MLILLCLWGGLSLWRHYASPTEPLAIQSMHVVLPPSIQQLVEIGSLDVLTESLKWANIKKRGADVLECNGLCFEIGVAGNVVKYFALDINGKTFDLKSLRTLSDAQLADRSIEKYDLLFVTDFMQTKTKELKDALEKASKR
jgi:hypothetical protein